MGKAVAPPGLRPKPQGAAEVRRAPDQLPARLVDGIRALSGFSLSNVRVRAHSAEATRHQAEAFARGEEIHLGPGGDRRLAHEAWHLVQQRQGRVRATGRLADGTAVNACPSLEAEADHMGARAMQISGSPDLAAAAAPAPTPIASPMAAPVLQGYFTGGSSGRMSQQELDAALALHPNSAQLTADMRSLIRKRHTHDKQKYVLDNTIASLVSGAVVPKPPAAAGKAVTRRTAAGYVNPAHDSQTGLTLLRAGAVSPIPANCNPRDHLTSQKRRFRTYTPTHTQLPVIVQGHSNVVLGHGPVDAVDDWNAHGHTRPRQVNLSHNSDATIYHGLEEKKASAKSGGKTVSRYRSPSPSDGSHPSHYQRDHPDFGGEKPWHTYDNAADAAARKRHLPVPLAFSAAPPQGAQIVKPIALPLAAQQPMPPQPQQQQWQAPPQQQPQQQWFGPQQQPQQQQWPAAQNFGQPYPSDYDDDVDMLGMDEDDVDMLGMDEED